MGGTSSNEGRVEVCVNGMWGTVTYYLWDPREATVVYKQLGYQNPSEWNASSSSQLCQWFKPPTNSFVIVLWYIVTVSKLYWTYCCLCMQWLLVIMTDCGSVTSNHWKQEWINVASVYLLSCIPLHQQQYIWYWKWPNLSDSFELYWKWTNTSGVQQQLSLSLPLFPW